MISQEDYNFIVAYDNALSDSTKRNALVRQQSQQCAKTFLNLLGHIAKDQTIQYLLVLIEDMLSVGGAPVVCFHIWLCRMVTRHRWLGDVKSVFCRDHRM